MKPTPVSVVIPCYNQGAYLDEAVASVARQTHSAVGCIVVDDGSTESATVRTLDRLGASGIRILRQPNGGLSNARNAGVLATDTPFFVPLDADDILEPRFIERLLPPLLADPTLGYVYCHVRTFGASEHVWPCRPYDSQRLLFENLSAATAVVRREAFDCAGGYQPDMVHGFEDWDFWIALLATGYRGKCVAEPLFLYRKHAGGTSMLDKTQAHRDEMIRRIIVHHRNLMASMLGLTGPDEEAIYQTLRALARLDDLENMVSWRVLKRLRFYRPCRALRRIIGGRQADAGTASSDPRERLAAIERSGIYRILRAFKRSALYNRYARLRYGPDFVNPFLD